MNPLFRQLFFVCSLLLLIVNVNKDAFSQVASSLNRQIDEKVKTGEIGPEKAWTYYLKFKNSKDYKTRALTSKILAHSYMSSGELDSVAKYINESITLYKKTNDNDGLLYARLVESSLYESMGDRTKSLKILYTAGQSLSDSSDIYLLVKIPQYAGYSALSLGKKDSARTLFEKALGWATKSGDTLLTASCLRSLAQYYSYISDYDSSLREMKLSMLLEKAYGKSPTLGRTLLNIGVLYSQTAKPQLALGYLKEALSVLKEKSDKVTYTWGLYNLATTYFDLNKIDSAMIFNEAAYKKFNTMNLPEGIAFTNFMRGEILYNKKKYHEAIGFYQIAENKWKSMDSPENLATVYNRIGSTYLDIKDYKQAEAYFLKGIKICYELNYQHSIKDNASGLAIVYENLGDYKKACNYLKIERQMRDSIFSAHSDSLSSELNARFDSEKKLLRIQVLGQENTIKSEKIQKNTIFIIVLIISILGLAVFAFMFIRQTKLTASLKNLQLDQKLLRSQMNPHFLFNALATIQGYMQENDPIKASVYLSDFSKLMRAILESSINDDIPLEKEVDIVKTYLGLQKVRLNDRFDFEVLVESDIEQDWVMVPPMLVQPFVENAVEYGMRNITTQGLISVSYKVANGKMEVEVCNNGPGLDSENAKLSAHRSRASEITRQRLQIIRKKFKKPVVLSMETIDPENNSGVKVFISIPVEID
jgi:tetratricopeptide (TPR) repeat protein